MRVKTKRGITFPSPIGAASGILVDGSGIDAIIGASGVDSNSGLATFIELGTCTPERQLPSSDSKSNTLRIDIETGKVTRDCSRFLPSV